MNDLNRRRVLVGTVVGLSGLGISLVLKRRFRKTSALVESSAEDYARPVVPVIDAHCHISQAMHSGFQAVMEQNGVRFAISQGYWKGIDYEVDAVSDIRRNYSSRFAAFYAPMWGSTEPNYLKSKERVIVTDEYLRTTLPEELQRFMIAGGANAVGLKLWRDLGARVYDTSGHLLQITDPRLLPVLTLAESLGAVVSIHSCGTCQSTRDELVARHPGLKFIYCHWGSLGDKLESLGATLDRYSNVLVDTSPAGSWPTAKGSSQNVVREFYARYQDRLAFGTDFVEVNRTECCQQAWWECFYRSFWRYHQTRDQDFSSTACSLKHWTGVGLNANLLRKVYWDNAYSISI